MTDRLAPHDGAYFVYPDGHVKSNKRGAVTPTDFYPDAIPDSAYTPCPLTL